MSTIEQSSDNTAIATDAANTAQENCEDKLAEIRAEFNKVQEENRNAMLYWAYKYIDNGFDEAVNLAYNGSYYYAVVAATKIETHIKNRINAISNLLNCYNINLSFRSFQRVIESNSLFSSDTTYYCFSVKDGTGRDSKTVFYFEFATCRDNSSDYKDTHTKQYSGVKELQYDDTTLNDITAGKIEVKNLYSPDEKNGAYNNFNDSSIETLKNTCYHNNGFKDKLDNFLCDIYENIAVAAKLDSSLIATYSNVNDNDYIVNNKFDIRDININGRHSSTGKHNRYYDLNSYLFVNPNITDGVANWTDTPAFSKLIINEFQPNVVATFADFFGENSVIGELISPLFNTIATIATPFTYYSKNTSFLSEALTGNVEDLFMFNDSDENPMNIVKAMFNNGYWTNIYEVPFWGNEWLLSNESKFFKRNSYSEVGEYGKLGVNTMGKDYPLNPRFKVNFSENRRKIKTEFYLINHDKNWTIKNYNFINCIFAGTLWVHLDKCAIQSPNVYHVECPGRFLFMWAAMDITVSSEGKLRKLDYSDSDFNKDTNNNKSIDENTLWPEYWKMTIDITDLTPNSYNAYANYMLSGDNSTEFKSTTTKLSGSSNIVIGKLLEKIRKEITNATGININVNSIDVNKTLNSNTMKVDADSQALQIDIYNGNID